MPEKRRDHWLWQKILEKTRFFLIENSIFNIFISQQLAKYEIVLETLKTEANVSNIDEFISIYNTQEQINEEMFQKSSELNEEAKANL